MQLSSSSSSSAAAALVPRLIPTSSSYVHRRSQVTSLSFSSPATRFSFLLSQTQLQPFPFHYKSRKRTRTRRKPVSAVFERFTERAIKAVIFSQREAKALGSEMVFTQHLLLGLIIEDNGNGFLGSGITIDQARLAVRHIWRHQIHLDDSDSNSNPNSGSAVQLPFSITTKRVLEAAVEYSRTRGHNFISPEHIAIGLFTADDGSAARVLQR